MVGVPVDKRVHVTRMVPPNTRDHVFLGDVNGAGAAVGNHGFDGDAATMKVHLVQFRADVIALLVAAQNKGWKFRRAASPLTCERAARAVAGPLRGLLAELA